MVTLPPPVPSEPPARAPAGVRDYLSLSKPGITGLIVAVAIAGYFLAAPATIGWVTLGILVVTGAAASAGAAMLNHYLDRDVDAQMRRTRRRPLPTARIDPSGTVAVLGLVLLGGGIAGACWFINLWTGFSIFLGGLTYVVVSTLWLKRRSSWNIVIGGFAGSAPALAGGAAAVGDWTAGVVAFAVLVFLWTPPHFWSLALLLREDYERAGLPMLPDMKDPVYSGKVVVVSAALLVPAALLIGWTGVLAWPVLVVLAALGLLFVALTLPLWRDVRPKTARRGFIYSGPYLLGVILAIIANWPLVRLGVPAFPF